MRGWFNIYREKSDVILNLPPMLMGFTCLSPIREHTNGPLRSIRDLYNFDRLSPFKIRN